MPLLPVFQISLIFSQQSCHFKYWAQYAADFVRRVYAAYSGVSACVRLCPRMSAPLSAADDVRGGQKSPPRTPPRSPPIRADPSGYAADSDVSAADWRTVRRGLPLKKSAADYVRRMTSFGQYTPRTMYAANDVRRVQKYAAHNVRRGHRRLQADRGEQCTPRTVCHVWGRKSIFVK